jgi:hypothetical protein
MDDQIRRIVVEETVKVLNRINEADPSVMPALIKMRVPCNDAVRDDETVQVGSATEGDGYEVGFLGILNGIFGIDENHYGFIYAYMGVEGTVIRFVSKWERKGE